MRGKIMTSIGFDQQIKAFPGNAGGGEHIINEKMMLFCDPVCPAGSEGAAEWACAPG